MPKVTVSKDNGIAFIKVPCPEEIFDTPDAVVVRRKRIAIWKLDSINAFQPGQEEEMYGLFAELIPEWHGVLDVETGEPLPNLAEDPRALTHLDTEQLAWLSGILRRTPANLVKNGTDPKGGTGLT
jgi:hypothetical protein